MTMKAENETTFCLFLIAASRDSLGTNSLKMFLVLIVTEAESAPSDAPSSKFYPNHYPQTQSWEGISCVEKFLFFIV